MSDGKYRIIRTRYGDSWYEWALYKGGGGEFYKRGERLLNFFPTWRAAIQAMDLDAARQAAVRNRIALGPIGTVNHA